MYLTDFTIYIWARIKLRILSYERDIRLECEKDHFFFVDATECMEFYSFNFIYLIIQLQHNTKNSKLKVNFK